MSGLAREFEKALWVNVLLLVIQIIASVYYPSYAFIVVIMIWFYTFLILILEIVTVGTAISVRSFLVAVATLLIDIFLLAIFSRA
jgi:hypothetical protein